MFSFQFDVLLGLKTYKKSFLKRFEEILFIPLGFLSVLLRAAKIQQNRSRVCKPL